MKHEGENKILTKTANHDSLILKAFLHTNMFLEPTCEDFWQSQNEFSTNFS